MDQVLYFQTPDQLYQWFAVHYHRLTEQWIGFYKIGSGVPSITWSESVDMALCFGWIDGVRHTVDRQRYKIRFTPRRLNSNWSDINLAKMKQLIKEGKVTKAGLAVYKNRRQQNNVKINLAYDDPSLIIADWLQEWKNYPDAQEFFNRQSAGYRRQILRWVISAKRDETRIRRINVLINYCQERKKMPLT